MERLREESNIDMAYKWRNSQASMRGIRGGAHGRHMHMAYLLGCCIFGALGGLLTLQMPE